ncbi:hypothetical protein ACW9HH_32640 [Nocardia gipuzkoensis]
MTSRIEWFHRVGSTFVALADVVEATFETTVAGHSAVASFPSKLPATIGGLPDGAAVKNPFDRPIAAGTTSPRVTIQGVLLTADIDGDDDELHDAAVNIVAAMEAWWMAVSSWLEIVTGQQVSAVSDDAAVTFRDATSIWTMPADRSEPVPFQMGTPFGAFRLDTTVAVSVEVLRHCFALAGSMTMPSPSWMLIRDARSLHRVHQYRRAVIDAGSAAEIATKTLIRENLPASLPPKLAKSLAGGTLGAALKTLEDSGYSTPPDRYNDRLVKLRNTVIHGEQVVSAEQSTGAIAVAVELVEAAEPLPKGLVRLWQ